MTATEQQARMATTSQTSKIDALVQELRASLKCSTVLTPASDGYAESIRRWSDAVEKRAGIVVYVGSAEDISSTILLSRKHSVDFVVCGGKHSSSGASSITGGLVLDMGKMRRVEVELASKTVRVQGGCIWKDVDEAAAEHGLAMVGGTVNHTGVGGLTLGGGYGWLSGRYGLTIDNLLRVQMVLADGSIVFASKDENPNLFWAVRGAGHCFGVAVEFTFQTYEQKNLVWAGQMVFPAAEKLEAVVNFANELVASTNGDSGMVMGITAPPFLKGPAVIATVFHNGPKEAAEAIFKPLLELRPLKNTATARPYREMNSLMNHAVDYGGRKISKGACFVTPLRPSFVTELVAELERFHARVPNTRKTILLFEFFHPDRWCAVPHKATAFANRGRHQNLMIGPFWDDAAQDTECRLWARGMAKRAKMELGRVQAESGDPDAVEAIKEYGNYDALLVNARDIFGDNYARLCEMKGKYDPDNVLNKSHNLAPSKCA